MQRTELNQRWQRGRFIVPAMTRGELREAIEKPAEARVMYFQSDDPKRPLIDRIIDLEASVQAIKAGKILQSQQATDLEVMNALQQVVFEGREYNRIEGHDKPVRSISISPDGKILASGSEDKTIKVWNLETGKKILTLKGHSDGFNSYGEFYSDSVNLYNSEIYSVSFSLDGKTLAMGSTDDTIKLWNLETGKSHTLTRNRSDEVISSVSFSPDGKTLAIACVTIYRTTLMLRRAIAISATMYPK